MSFADVLGGIPIAPKKKLKKKKPPPPTTPPPPAPRERSESPASPAPKSSRKSHYDTKSESSSSKYNIKSERSSSKYDSKAERSSSKSERHKSSKSSDRSRERSEKKAESKSHASRKRRNSDEEFAGIPLPTKEVGVCHVVVYMSCMHTRIHVMDVCTCTLLTHRQIIMWLVFRKMYVFVMLDCHTRRMYV